MKKICFFLFIIVSLFSCEEYNLSETKKNGNEGKDTVIISKGDYTLALKVSSLAQTESASNSSVELKDVCSRLNFALFSKDGTKIAAYNQEAEGNDNFGNLEVKLDKGNYTLVVIGHNGLGNATISRPDSIRFKDNKVTDTFTFCEEINLEADMIKNISLERKVAMFRLILNEKVPKEVKQLKFYYTGGSSTLNAFTGFGIVDSRQTEYRDIPESAHIEKGSFYEIYTFPHSNTDYMKLIVSGLDASGNIVRSLTINEIKIIPRTITQYTCRVFTDGEPPQLIIGIKDNSWGFSEIVGM